MIAKRRIIDFVKFSRYGDAILFDKKETRELVPNGEEAVAGSSSHVTEECRFANYMVDRPA